MSTRKSNDHENDRDEALDAVRETFDAEVPPELQRRLRQSMSQFRRDLREHPYVRRLARHRDEARAGRDWRGVLRLGLAAASGAAVCAAIVAGLMLLPGAPSWAAVAERFRSVPFVSAVIYLNDGALDPPFRFELWAASDGRARVRYDSQVIFAWGGQVITAFDVETREEVEADHDAAQMLELLGTGGDFSLDNILRAFPVQGMEDVTPAVNADAAISEDLIVFDLEREDTLAWLRVWALRESELPVRLRVWDPRNAQSVDAFFTYSKEQPPEFFDPDAFALTLAMGHLRAAELAYAHLKDPGGRPITREDAEREREARRARQPEPDHRLPVVEQVTIMPDGAICVVSIGSHSDRPDFAEMKDDLGRTYHRARATWHDSDRSTKVFLPEDYPFDARRPTRLTLLVKRWDHVRQPDGTSKTVEVSAGSVEVDAIEEATMWPEHATDFDPLTAHARHLIVRRNDFARARRVLELIPGEPADSEDALRREQFRVEMLVKERSFDEAVAVGHALEPLLLAKYGALSARSPRYRDARLHDFLYCLAALAGAGEIDRARALFAEIADSPIPEAPQELAERIREKVRRAIAERPGRELPAFAHDLRRLSGITIEDLNTIVGRDMLKDPRFAELCGLHAAEPGT